ncbi:MAG: hypothetical protein KDB23_32995, partial [Planctomycetales bacterium]|nr:hypothetical protein [Planctomycetales bacterium]
MNVLRKTTWTCALIAISLFAVEQYSSAAEPTWRIETIAGNGAATTSPLSAPRSTSIGNPFGVEVGPDGGLYICEVSHHRLWRLDRQAQRLTIVAGTGTAGYSGDGGPP